MLAAMLVLVVLQSTVHLGVLVAEEIWTPPNVPNLTLFGIAAQILALGAWRG